MNTPTTATEALRHCELLWEELARTGSSNKENVTFVVLGYYPENACPACEYDTSQNTQFNYPFCAHCPVDAWRNSYGITSCVSHGSPFHDWYGTVSLEARQAAALSVLDLVRASEAYLPEPPNVS